MMNAYAAATKRSLSLLFTDCLALQILTNAHAATASDSVHIIGDIQGLVGTTVEKMERYKGDY